MNAVVLLQAAGVTPGSAAEAVVAVSGAQEREHWEANAQRWELLRNHCTNVENSKRTCALCSVFLWLVGFCDCWSEWPSVL